MGIYSCKRKTHKSMITLLFYRYQRLDISTSGRQWDDFIFCVGVIIRNMVMPTTCKTILQFRLRKVAGTEYRRIQNYLISASWCQEDAVFGSINNLLYIFAHNKQRYRTYCICKNVKECIYTMIFPIIYIVGNRQYVTP